MSFTNDLLLERTRLFNNSTQQYIVDKTNTGIIYEGFAAHNKLTTEEAWKIKRTVVSNGVITQGYANSGEYNCSWINRATYFDSESGFINNLAVEFDGINDYAWSDDPAFISDMSGDWSISMWFSPQNLTATLKTMLIISSQSSDTPILAWIQINDSSLYFAARGDGGTVGAIQPTITWVEDEYYHVGITRDGNVFTMYINGVSVGTATIATGTTTVDQFALGATKRTSVSAGSYYSGAIDEPAIFKRALTDGEMLQIGSAGLATSLDSFGSDLIANWRMGDNVNDEYPTIADTVASADLTMVNMVQSSFVTSGV